METTSTGISIPDGYLLDNAEALQIAIERSISLKVGETLDTLAKAIRSSLDAPKAVERVDTFSGHKVYRATITASLDELKNHVNQQLVTISRIKHLQARKEMIDSINNLKEE